MNAFYVSLGLSCLLAGSLSARPIPESTAASVARHFYQTTAKGAALRDQLRLDNVYSSMARLHAEDAEETALFHIYTINENQGFVIVAADDAVSPILAYSEEGGFDADRIPQNVEKWLEQYEQEISYVISHSLPSDRVIEEQWANWLSAAPELPAGSRQGVNPLVTTKWDQGGYYNDLCPGGSVTGCVATAMAQVMKYWNHPAQGTGFHSYNEDDYGTLSANFGGTAYNWTSMPNVVSSPNTAVATLMYHCGVSVDMNYSPSGSGAYTCDVLDALTTYFGYNSSTIQCRYRSDYSEADWINVLKAELNAGRPIQYAGTGSGGGHSFVCDGYDNNNFFHFNWGWGGSSDGYFSVNALNPGSLGTGGGTGGFNSNQRAITGIQPVGGGSTTAAMSLYSSITVNPNPILYQQSVTVNADIINTGSSTFYGEITAALFDANYNFVEYIQTLNETNGLPVNYHYTGGINFSNTLSAVPGSYYIGIFVKPSGGNWIQVGNGSYQNMIPVSIHHPNTMQMYGAISITPATLAQNQPASIWVDVINTGSTDFTGTISLDLHDVNGNWVQEINSITGLTLPAGYHFTNGLTFSTGGLNVAPGSYQVAVWELVTGGNWELVQATSTYINPKPITIIQPILSPDAYENNNTSGTAYSLPLSFAGNQATPQTPGANIHTSTDYDYYKLVLPAGFNYTINARLHDSYNSANGQSYTNDALWSYSTNSGSTWSATYDDILTTGNIVVSGGSTIYFKVASYYQGTTGTYLFDIQASRSNASGVQELLPASDFRLFPNPARTAVYVDNPEQRSIQSIQLWDVNGRLLRSQAGDNSAQAMVSLDGIAPGVYLLSVITEQGVWTERLLIQ